ncbi:unnamed protein product, partial [Prorocentrum cordatum]
VTDDDGSLHCWIGFGSDCFHSARKAHITSAQRILRGSFRVLMDLKGFEVGEAYLKKVFDALPEDSHGFGQSVDEAARQCNHTCLSLVTCELWQYSSKVGCQINDPKFKALPYPLTTAVVHTGTPKAEAVIAGAYIQRACKSAPKRGPSKLAAEIVRNATTKVSTTEASTVTSTTGPSTTSVTTTAVTTTTVTSKTTILPLAPLPGEPDLFIRGKQASEVYFRDGETSTKHLVRFNSCSRCPKKVQELCGRPAQVTEGEILGLETGEDFECDMFNPGEARPVEDQMQTVPPQHGRGPSAPTDKLDESDMTTLTDRSTTTTTTAALAAALGAGAHHAARRGGLPWWLWALLLAGIVGIVACVAYAARHKRRGRSPPRTRASRLQKEASGATGSTAAHDKSFSLASSFDSEAAAPLMASPPDGQAPPLSGRSAGLADGPAAAAGAGRPADADVVADAADADVVADAADPDDVPGPGLGHGDAAGAGRDASEWEPAAARRPHAAGEATAPGPGPRRGAAHVRHVAGVIFRRSAAGGGETGHGPRNGHAAGLGSN